MHFEDWKKCCLISEGDQFKGGKIDVLIYRVFKI